MALGPQISSRQLYDSHSTTEVCSPKGNDKHALFTALRNMTQLQQKLHSDAGVRHHQASCKTLGTVLLVAARKQAHTRAGWRKIRAGTLTCQQPSQTSHHHSTQRHTCPLPHRLHIMTIRRPHACACPPQLAMLHLDCFNIAEDSSAQLQGTLPGQRALRTVTATQPMHTGNPQATNG